MNDVLFNYNVNSLCKDHNFFVWGVSSMNNPHDNTIMFLTMKNLDEAEAIEQCKYCLIFIPEECHEYFMKNESHCFIKSDDSRRDYAMLVSSLIEENESKMNEEIFEKDGSYFSKKVKLEENVVIEPFCFINGEVTIKKNTVIKSGVKINGEVTIGENCIIRENSTIGTEGFSFVDDKNGNKIRFPFLGSVSIGENVEVGALCNIERAIADSTILQDYTKLDSMTFIGHDVTVGKNSLIVSSLLAGHVSVGNNSFVGFGSVVKQRIRIGKHAVIGAGAVVTKNIQDYMTVAGNPARELIRK
jgi:UDP-3-O-[3-hydroxymyristoyl] glucosamine N-acyltransferase